jgi:Putative transposase
MTHHPHVHMIVTGGGISKDGSQWVASRRDYLVSVEVLSALFRGRMLGMLIDVHAAGRLQFFGNYKHLADKAAFRAYLGPLWTTDWFVYAKRPFAGPEQVLAYLSRYTHRVAISNRRLISADASGVTFTYKDYRIEGPERYKTMTLEPGEFIRRFLMHVLPKGFHRIRHYGLLANGGTTRAEKLARARQLIAAAPKIVPSNNSPHDHGTCEDTTPSEELDPLGALLKDDRFERFGYFCDFDHMSQNVQKWIERFDLDVRPLLRRYDDSVTVWFSERLRWRRRHTKITTSRAGGPDATLDQLCRNCPSLSPSSSRTWRFV